MKPKWYWFTFAYAPLSVTVHAQKDHCFHWTAIRGVQIGSWFFGAIRGNLASSDGTNVAR